MVAGRHINTCWASSLRSRLLSASARKSSERFWLSSSSSQFRPIAWPRFRPTAPPTQPMFCSTQPFSAGVRAGRARGAAISSIYPCHQGHAGGLRTGRVCAFQIRATSPCICCLPQLLRLPANQLPLFASSPRSFPFWAQRPNQSINKDLAHKAAPSLLFQALEGLGPPSEFFCKKFLTCSEFGTRLHFMEGGIRQPPLSGEPK